MSKQNFHPQIKWSIKLVFLQFDRLWFSAFNNLLLNSSFKWHSFSFDGLQKPVVEKLASGAYYYHFCVMTNQQPRLPNKYYGTCYSGGIRVLPGQYTRLEQRRRNFRFAGHQFLTVSYSHFAHLRKPVRRCLPLLPAAICCVHSSLALLCWPTVDGTLFGWYIWVPWIKHTTL